MAVDDFSLLPKKLIEKIKNGQFEAEFEDEDLIEIKQLIEQIDLSKRKKKTSKKTAPESESSLEEKKSTRSKLEKTLKYFIENQKWIEETIVKGRKNKFRQAGHLTDQTLKYKGPNNQQLSLFDLITEDTIEKIKESKIEVKAEGIRLTPSEDRIIKALSRLMHEKRESYAEDIYSNDQSTFQLSPYGDNMAKAPILRISPSELYKAYLDRPDYSGEEIKYIKKILSELSKKTFLIIYDRKRMVKGKEVTDRIEVFQNLVKIMSYIEGLTSAELKKLDEGDESIRESKGELVIGLNPIFIDQIGTKYVEFPVDINKRTSIAAGGHLCVTESIIILRDYMLREISAKREEVEINADKLPYMLHLHGYIKRRRKKELQERILKAIETVKNMGIIKHYKQVVGARGQNKYVFLLNKDFG